MQSSIFRHFPLVYGSLSAYGIDANHVGFTTEQLFAYRNFEHGFNFNAQFHSQ